MNGLLEQLIDMSRRLGDPAADLAILGEGNTSVRADAESFWVKASGAQLAQAEADSFVRVRFAPILESLAHSSMNDEEVRALLTGATCEGSKTPSIETFLHALCLQLPDSSFCRAHASYGGGRVALQPAESRVVRWFAVSRPDRVARFCLRLCAVHRSGTSFGTGRARGNRAIPAAVRAAATRDPDGEPWRDRLGQHAAGGAEHHADAGQDLSNSRRRTAGRWTAISVGPARSAHRQPSRRTRAAQEAVAPCHREVSFPFTDHGAPSTRGTHRACLRIVALARCSGFLAGGG